MNIIQLNQLLNAKIDCKTDLFTNTIRQKSFEKIYDQQNVQMLPEKPNCCIGVSAAPVHQPVKILYSNTMKQYDIHALSW